MTPYISHKSTFIIFIICINIVSVCLLYQPIKEDPITINQQKFMYLNYLKALNELTDHPNLEKLDVDQYYNSYYTMPEVKNENNYDYWKERQINYCNEEYVRQSHFETTYYVGEFGTFMNNLRECLKDSYVFKILKYCCHPNRITTEKPVECLGVLEEGGRNEVTKCFEPFKNEVSKLFGKKPENLKYTYNLEFTKTNLGKRAEIAFGIVTDQEEPNELCDEDFEDLSDNYKKFTGDTTYYDTDTSQSKCLENFEKYNHKKFDEWRSKYNVLKGFNNFKEFSRQIKISLKYLEGLEGKLVNNKKLYDKFHDNPISEDDFRELSTPLPLKHENFYPLYFMRIKFLGYIPVDNHTWKKQMTELNNSHSPNIQRSPFIQGMSGILKSKRTR
eukprot:XP_016658090.1 PREDICTED: uncharacterized protein LOC100568758 isoform X2 [Acyrthosiphon pisum]